MERNQTFRALFLTVVIMKKSSRHNRMSAPKQPKQKPSVPLARIKVVGVGGGGGNAVSRMSKDFIRGVEFIAINTDHQDLDHCAVRRRLYIGKNLTRGLGTGMNPDLGRQAAEENRSEIAEAVKDTDLVFIAAGLGGGTGTGVSPVVAEVAKQAGALTLAFVTKPFVFEGSQRQRIAEEGLMKLKDKVDVLIVVPNDRIFIVISKDTSLVKAFEAIDDVLRNALEGLVELIVTPGIINLDFADVRSVMQDAGVAIVGVGVGSGQDRAVKAVNLALHSPLLEISPEGARGVLLGIAARDLKMSEINEAAKLVAQTVDPGARIIFGAYNDRRLKEGQLKVTLVATGINGQMSPTSLFGGYLRDRKDSFDIASSKPPVPLKPASSGEKAGAKTELQSERRDKTDDRSSESSGDDSDSKAIKVKVQKTDADAWDIPTFLRRKKR